MANIIKRGGSFRIRVSLGFDGNGKRIIKNKTYTPPANLTPKQAQKEAERQAALFEEQCRTGQILDSTTRFREFVEIWLHDYAEKQLKATTLRRYKNLLTRINAAFGNMKLSAIQPHHLLAFYDNLEESGVRTDIKYRPLPLLTGTVKERKLPTDRLARLAGIASSTTKNALDGKNVSKECAKKLAKALEMDFDKLFEQCKDKVLADSTIL